MSPDVPVWVRTIFAGAMTAWAIISVLEILDAHALRDAMKAGVQRRHRELRRKFFATAHKWARMEATRVDAERALFELEAFEAHHGLEPSNWTKGETC